MCDPRFFAKDFERHGDGFVEGVDVRSSNADFSFTAFCGIDTDFGEVGPMDRIDVVGAVPEQKHMP